MSETANPLPDGVVKVIDYYSPEYPDDSRIKRTVHVMEDGDERVVFEASRDEDRERIAQQPLPQRVGG